MIYFIRASHSGSIKIGTSNDPRGRFATLQTGSPEPLELIGVIPGQMEEERRLHETFARFRIHGEWFKGTPELLAEIKKLVGGHGTPTIQDLVDRTGTDIWLVRGAFATESGSGDVDLVCVCRERTGRAIPDFDDMLDAVHSDGRFIDIDLIVNVTARQKYWPEDVEMLREPLTSKLSPNWAASFSSSDQFFPVLTLQQKQAMRTHPTTAFVVGSPVIHPQYGAGLVAVLHGFGAERRGRIDFIDGTSKVFVLERSPLKLGTHELVEAAVKAKEEPLIRPEVWQPRWMKPSNS